MTPRTATLQAPLSVGFSRQEYWSGLLFPSPGDLLTQESNAISCIGRYSLYHQATWEAQYHVSVQFSSVVQSCPTLCNPMNHSTPGLPVHHQLPEFTQTHVHQVSYAISSTVIPFSCPQSLPASENFPMSQLFA